MPPRRTAVPCFVTRRLAKKNPVGSTNMTALVSEGPFTGPDASSFMIGAIPPSRRSLRRPQTPRVGSPPVHEGHPPAEDPPALPLLPSRSVFVAFTLCPRRPAIQGCHAPRSGPLLLPLLPPCRPLTAPGAARRPSTLLQDSPTGRHPSPFPAPPAPAIEHSGIGQRPAMTPASLSPRTSQQRSTLRACTRPVPGRR